VLASVRLSLAGFPDGTRLEGPEQRVDRTVGLDRSVRPHYRASRRQRPPASSRCFALPLPGSSAMTG
jgi:hypothetical protein